MTEVEDLYTDFTSRLSLLIAQHPQLIVTTLSNVFTMRLIGNKTHGDLAEVAISEFINQFMYDFESKHVGKDLFRAKSSEEDILVKSLITGKQLPISLKAYGDGPLQLSTDKETVMFPYLESLGVDEITDRSVITTLFDDLAFKNFSNINVLPLIYDEKKKKCNIMVFDSRAAKASTVRVVKLLEGHGRRHQYGGSRTLMKNTYARFGMEVLPRTPFSVDYGPTPEMPCRSLNLSLTVGSITHTT